MTSSPARPQNGKAKAPFTAGGLTANFFRLATGESLAKLFTFFAFTYLGRMRGQADYGAVEFTIAVMIFFTLPVDFGLSHYGARELAKENEPSSRLLDEIFTLRLMLSLVSFAALLGFVLVLPHQNEPKLLLLFYGASLLVTPFLLQWFFQAQNRMGVVAWVSIVRQSTFAALLLLLLRPDTPLHYLGLVEFASVAAAGLFCLFVLRVRLRHPLPRLNFATGRLATHMKAALPIGTSELTWASLWYLATVLLGLIAAGGAVGVFGAAHRVTMAVHTFVWLYFFNLLPSITRCVALPKSRYLDLMDGSITVSVWVGLLIALGATFLAGPGMALIFGPAFESSGGALAILIWIIPVALLSGHYRFTLLAYSHQKWLMICSGLAAMFSAGLCVVLIPRFGPQGAASALLAALTFELLLTRYAVHRIIHSIPLARAIAPSLVAAAVSVALREGILFAGNWWAAAAALSLYLALGIIGNRSRLQVFAGFLQQRYAPAGVSQRWKALSPLQRVLTQEVEP